MIQRALKARLRADGNILLQVKVVPKSNRSAFAGEMDDGTLKIRVAAVAEKGKANEELIDFLSAYFEIKKANVEIISGATSPHKLIRLSL